jgi:hypothetical protein
MANSRLAPAIVRRIFRIMTRSFEKKMKFFAVKKNSAGLPRADRWIAGKFGPKRPRCPE